MKVKVKLSISVINQALCHEGQSQWSRGLRNEMSSPARMLGSWVRMPHEAWMSVCVYSVFVLGSGLATGRSLVQGVLLNVLD
jgi:hypothetical protein